jgi:3-dehydroquinate synthase
LTNYKINHGQAITIGMGLANFISWRLGYLKEGDYQVMRELINKNSPAFRLTKKQEDAYLISLSKDKKNIGQQLTCILLKAPGKAFKTNIPLDNHLRQTIREYFGNHYHG